MSGDGPTETSLPTSPNDSTSSLVDDLLAQDRATLDEVPIAGLFDKIAKETVDREPTVRDRLRELATPARLGIAIVALIAGGAGVVSVLGMRPDLEPQGLLWLAGLHVFILAGSIVGLAFALRATHRPPLNGLAWAAVAVILAMPLALALVPGLLPGMSGSPPAVAHVACGGGSLVMALPATVLVLLLDRSEEPAAWRVMLAAGSAGLSAFGFGYWQCPSVDPLHLILAHAGLGAGLGLVTLLVVRGLGWLRRRR